MPGHTPDPQCKYVRTDALPPALDMPDMRVNPREKKPTVWVWEEAQFIWQASSRHLSFPGGSMVKNLSANAGDTGSIPGLGISPEKKMTAYSSILPGKSQGQRSLVGYSP